MDCDNDEDRSHFDGAGQEMTIVRETRCKWGPIVE